MSIIGVTYDNIKKISDKNTSNEILKFSVFLIITDEDIDQDRYGNMVFYVNEIIFHLNILQISRYNVTVN